jgi:hypothetical protein
MHASNGVCTGGEWLDIHEKWVLLAHWQECWHRQSLSDGAAPKPAVDGALDGGANMNTAAAAATAASKTNME